MRTIILHGSLADHLPAEYEGRFTCDCRTAKEAANAINVNFPGFFDKIREMQLYVVDGDANNVSLDEDQVEYNLVGDELHFIPKVDGEGGRTGKAILGGILMVVAIVGTLGMAAPLGAAAFGGSLMGVTGTTLLLGGASMVYAALTMPAAPPKTEAASTDKSIVYTGPLNTQEEGDPVPYTAGRGVYVGGIVIHTDLIIRNEI